MVRGADGLLERIVEQRDASEEEKKICEVNSGAYWFNCDDLLGALDDINSMCRDKKEIYLTDAIEILLNQSKRADAFTADSPDIICGANDRVQLSQLNETARKRIFREHMTNGVDIPCADGVIIAPGVRIGADTQILPGTIIIGHTEIGSDCVIGPNSRIESVSYTHLTLPTMAAV